jgi:hypothetical protein
MGDVIDLTGEPPARAEPKLSAPAPAAAPTPVAKKQKAAAKGPRAGHALLWIPFTCKGGKKARLVGVYDTKAQAQAARAKLMEQHECCGHGDIVVGDSWEDEISLVVLPAPLFL